MIFSSLNLYFIRMYLCNVQVYTEWVRIDLVECIYLGFSYTEWVRIDLMDCTDLVHFLVVTGRVNCPVCVTAMFERSGKRTGHAHCEVSTYVRFATLYVEGSSA